MAYTGSHDTRYDIVPTNSEFAEGFGAFLGESGLLNDRSLRRALRLHHQTAERFEVVLTRLGLLSEADLAQAYSEYLRLPLLSQSDLPHKALFADQLPSSFLSSMQLVPIADHGDRLLLAMADPFNEEAVAALAFQLSRNIEICVATPADIGGAIKRLYTDAAEDRNGVGLTEVEGSLEGASEADISRLRDLASEAPIIRLVHDLVSRAVEAHASDIHFEPHNDSLHVRFRIDGVLHTMEVLPATVCPAVTSRLKILARMNIAERRLPQDGRVKETVQGREIDLRVSTMPTMNGESVVLRLLDRSSVELEFTKLGLGNATRAQFTELLQEPNGIILVTGPTGSGKTTTLYTALSMLNSPERKTFTVEDPIEYELAGVNQIQVQPKIGLSFANTLRSILRQDPDIVMVGEIRDLETAQVAIQASLTGHLVLSTLHTNSAAATVARLIDMGVEGYLLASSLKGILAQRLVRRLCSQCSAPSELTPVLRNRMQGAGLSSDLSSSVNGLRQPIGCDACRWTGFHGRTMICELLVLRNDMHQTVIGEGSERVVHAAMRQSGIDTMFVDGLKKVLNGETTLEEILRVSRMEP